jgi:nitrite reductase/ring-hydroxylating ferredoxin subunit
VERSFHDFAPPTPVTSGAPLTASGTKLARGAAMSSTIRIATVHELPPGKGKVVEVAGRSFTVYNRDGRFFATSSHAQRRAPIGGDTSHTCTHGGLEFDVWTEDSPARLLDQQDRCSVRVEDDGVYLLVSY